MDTDHVGGLLLGIFLVFAGYSTATSLNPTVTVYADFKAPVVTWLPWIFIPVGLLFTITNVYGIYTDRKKEREHRERLHREKASQPSQEPPQA